MLHCSYCRVPLLLYYNVARGLCRPCYYYTGISRCASCGLRRRIDRAMHCWHCWRGQKVRRMMLRYLFKKDRKERRERWHTASACTQQTEPSSSLATDTRCTSSAATADANPTLL